MVPPRTSVCCPVLVARAGQALREIVTRSRLVAQRCLRYARAVEDETDLVRRLRAGDEAAFSALVDGMHGALMRLAELFVGRGASAEEVVQDTWLAVLDGLDRFEGRSSLRTWIGSILANQAKTRRARERRDQLLFLPDAELSEAGKFNDLGFWSDPPRP